MKIEILSEGFVAQVATGARATDIAVGPRLAVTSAGEIVCSLMLTAKTAVNDFVPVLCRSADNGRTWSEPVPVWPHLRQLWSLFVSISRDSGGRLFLYGTRCPIDAPGETMWSDATQGLKANELVWAVSTDDGRTWREPRVIPMPIPGAAEAPGALCVTRGGRWIAPYSPYNTFDPAVKVDRSQVVAVWSDDEGRTWDHTAMLRFSDPRSGGAEAWIAELSDGRLLGTCWHVSQDGVDLPNAFAVSRDGGATWTAAASTGILGQSTALASWADGRAVFLYNQRRHGQPGVRLAVVRPDGRGFGVEHDAIVWRAETRTRTATSGGLEAWSDFSFGEPAAARLADGTWLVALWCIQPSGTGIRCVTARIGE